MSFVRNYALSKFFGGSYDQGYSEAFKIAEDIIENTIVEITSNATTVAGNKFWGCAQLKKAHFPQCTKIGASGFRETYALVDVYFPKLETVGSLAFYSCNMLESIDLPELISVGLNCFQGSAKLKNVNIPKATAIGLSAFQNCGALESIDLPSAAAIRAQVFQDDVALKTVILRANAVCTLDNANAFTNTPIANGKGYIYVPAELVDSYKVATNWSAYANQIVAIEGSLYE